MEKQLTFRVGTTGQVKIDKRLLDIYPTFNRKQHQLVNAFIDENCFFAYNDKQAEEGLAKLKCTTKDIVRTTAGMYCLKSKVDQLRKIMNESTKALHYRMFISLEFAVSAFIAELENHEYTYTYELDDTLDALLLNTSIINKKPVLIDALKIAISYAENGTTEFNTDEWRKRNA